MTIRTLIVDDEPLAIERMQLMCAKEPRIALVGMATDGQAALRLIGALKPQLVMLDIAMPLLDGIGVARAITRMDHRPAIIFVTAFEGFAVEAFDLAAVDYLLKPVGSDRLTRAMDRVETALNAKMSVLVDSALNQRRDWAEEFWVPHRSELIRITASQIDRIEAERDYMRLHVGSRSYLLHQTISSLEERLNPEQFIRLHRSHIVRRDYISRLRHDGSGIWYACLTNDEEIRIGRTFLSNARALSGR